MKPYLFSIALAVVTIAGLALPQQANAHFATVHQPIVNNWRAPVVLAPSQFRSPTFRRRTVRRRCATPVYRRNYRVTPRFQRSKIVLRPHRWF